MINKNTPAQTIMKKNGFHSSIIVSTNFHSLTYFSKKKHLKIQLIENNFNTLNV